MSKATSQLKPPSSSFLLYNSLWSLAALGAIYYITTLVLEAGTPPVQKQTISLTPPAIENSQDKITNLNNTLIETNKKLNTLSTSYDLLEQKITGLSRYTTDIRNQNSTLGQKIEQLENDLGIVTGTLARSKKTSAINKTKAKKRPALKAVEITRIAPNKKLIEVASNALENGNSKKLPEPVINQEPVPKSEKKSKPPLDITPKKLAMNNIPIPVLRPQHKVKKPQISHTHFAIELGTHANLLELKASWLQLSKQHAAMLEILHPRYVTIVVNNQARYKLISGPLPNALDAAKICYNLSQANIPCKQTRFLGTPL